MADIRPSGSHDLGEWLVIGRPLDNAAEAVSCRLEEEAFVQYVDVESRYGGAVASTSRVPVEAATQPEEVAKAVEKGGEGRQGRGRGGSRGQGQGSSCRIVLRRDALIRSPVSNAAISNVLRSPPTSPKVFVKSNKVCFAPAALSIDFLRHKNEAHFRSTSPLTCFFADSW